jgi:hypothetical protein
MEKFEKFQSIAIGVAVTGAIAIVGYSVYKCYRKKKRLSMSTLTSCFFTGAIESAAETAADLAKWGWKKGIKPGAVELYKKGLKPIGKTIFNKALKPGFKQLKNIPKKLEHDSQKAFKKIGNETKKAAKKTGKGILKGLKKVVRFGF